MTEPASRADPEIGDEPVSKVAIASPQPDDPHDGLEFQIALDSLAMGNTEPLKRHCKPLIRRFQALCFFGNYSREILEILESDPLADSRVLSGSSRRLGSRPLHYSIRAIQL